MAKMRAAQVSHVHGSLDLVERDIPEPGAGEVRIRVQACGICHSDTLSRSGTFPGLRYPRIPGHEVAGTIDAIGPGVVGWKAGDRAGAGWHGGHCGHCESCRRGDWFACRTATLVTGITSDGGYADYMIARAEAVARIPDALTAVEAAPLMCAGVTTFHALRSSGARGGDLVAVLGLGGLGHLGVQYAAKMGMRTVGIARGKDKEALARQLGASSYIDSTAQDPAEALSAMGGASVILATVTDGPAMSAAIGGLAANGTFMVIGAAPSLEVPPLVLIAGRRSIQGWYSGVAIDSQDAMEFSVLAGVRSMNETFPLERANEAYERMLSGRARFRVVLAMEQ